MEMDIEEIQTKVCYLLEGLSDEEIGSIFDNICERYASKLCEEYEECSYECDTETIVDFIVSKPGVEKEIIETIEDLTTDSRD